MNGLSGSSATAQCVSRPSNRSSGRAAEARGQGDRVGRVGTHAVHARVDLEVHRERGGVGARRSSRGVGRRVDAGRGVEGGTQVELDHVAHLVERRLRQQEHRRIDAGGPQLRSFLDQRHAEAVGARGERRAGHLHRAVAVAVGLHHRAEPGGRDVLPESRHVVGDRRQVDLRPGGAHPYRSARVTRPRHPTR